MLLFFLTLIMIALFVVSGDNFADQFGGAPKFCPPYRCPKGQEPVPKWPLKIESMGCSMGGGGMQMLQPGKEKAPDVHEECCDLRHACLQTCGSINTHCEEEFTKCSDAVCDAMTDGKKEKCKSSLGIHKLMIQMQGNGPNSCQQYDALQFSHCDCVPTDQANAKRERILRNFYRKFNPDAVDKVPSLMKKIDGNKRKMVGLLLALYKKFPKAISKVKDPQQEMMENMMRDVKTEKEEEVEEIDEDVEESDAEDLGTDEL